MNSLFKSEHSYRAILEGAVEGILLADLETKHIAYANPAACTLFGFSLEELLELKVLDLHPPEHIDEVLKVFEAQARGEMELACSIPCQRKNGTTFYADINTSRCEIDGVAYNVGFFTDVTERQSVEEAIFTTERLLVSIFDAVPDLLIVIDRNFKIRYTNFKGHDTIEQKDPEKGKTCFGRFKLLDEPCEDCTALPVFETGCTVEREMANPVDGITREVRAFPIKDQKGEVIYVVEYVRDITERKQAEDNRLRLEKQILQTQKLESLGIMAGGIAHDFNNLLSGIFGNIDLARLMSKDDTIKDHLDTAMRTMTRAQSLTHQLLTFAKGGLPVRKTGDLGRFVKETSKFALSGSIIKCKYTIPNDLWNCDFDENQLGQAIDNLIINALQSMSTGGIIRIVGSNIIIGLGEHNTLPAGKYVNIAIEDKGIGIPVDIQSRIFDPFFTTKEEGSGLGLATTYSIIKKHDGHIDVTSEPGKGSTFTLYIPASGDTIEESPQEEADTHTGKGVILVMDDEMVVRFTLKEMLKSFGYASVSAKRGEEALVFFRDAQNQKEPYAAIILDLTIAGGLGGKEVVEEIRKVDQNIPVFVTSGYAEDPIIAKPQEYGFTASLKKPFTTSELASLLNTYVQSS